MGEQTLLSAETVYQTVSKYDWCKKVRTEHESLFWETNKVDHSKTKHEFYKGATEQQQEVMLRILLFFTQADTSVCNNYIDVLIPLFKGQEVQSMLVSFANRENTHVEAYAQLVETLALPADVMNNFFHRFKDIESMQAKNDFLESWKITDFLKHCELDSTYNGATFKSLVLKNLIVFGAFTEGLQLYGSFCILLEPYKSKNGGLLKGVNEAVSWSMLDEDIHCKSIIKLAKVFIEENPECWTLDLQNSIVDICSKIVDLEFKFIDYIFEPLAGEPFFNLSSDDVKKYIKYLADLRLKQLGLPPLYRIDTNPQPYMDSFLVSGMSNFFESTVTDYRHGALKDSWDTCEF